STERFASLAAPNRRDPESEPCKERPRCTGRRRQVERSMTSLQQLEATRAPAQGENQVERPARGWTPRATRRLACPVVSRHDTFGLGNRDRDVIRSFKGKLAEMIL